MKEDTVIYNHPTLGRAITLACGIARLALHLCAFCFVRSHLGYWAACAIVCTIYLLEEANKETVYAHSNLGLGPGRFETFLEDLARAARDTLVLGGIATLAELSYKLMTS